MGAHKPMPLSLRILDIKVTKFSQFELLSEFDDKKFPLVNFRTNFNFKIAEEEEKIICILSIQVKILETDELFAELITETHFFVTPFSSVVTKIDEESSMDIKKGILYNLTNIAVSTTRGILYEKLKGSVAQRDIYPLTDLSKVFEPDTIEK